MTEKKRRINAIDVDLQCKQFCLLSSDRAGKFTAPNLLLSWQTAKQNSLHCDTRSLHFGQPQQLIRLTVCHYRARLLQSDVLVHVVQVDIFVVSIKNFVSTLLQVDSIYPELAELLVVVIKMLLPKSCEFTVDEGMHICNHIDAMSRASVRGSYP